MPNDGTGNLSAEALTLLSEALAVLDLGSHHVAAALVARAMEILDPEQHTPTAERLSVHDTVGASHADIVVARADAIDRIRSIVADESAGGAPNLRRAVRITDEAGTTLMIVRFAEAYS
jgi:hypothetical protein